MSHVVIRPNQVTVTTHPTPTRVIEVDRQGAADGGDGSPSYQRTFTQADLSIAGLLPVEHNLNLYPSAIALYDSSGEWVLPDRVEYFISNTLAIDLTSFTPIQGVWTLRIGG